MTKENSTPGEADALFRTLFLTPERNPAPREWMLEEIRRRYPNLG